MPLSPPPLLSLRSPPPGVATDPGARRALQVCHKGNCQRDLHASAGRGPRCGAHLRAAAGEYGDGRGLRQPGHSGARPAAPCAAAGPLGRHVERNPAARRHPGRTAPRRPSRPRRSWAPWVREAAGSKGGRTGHGGLAAAARRAHRTGSLADVRCAPRARPRRRCHPGARAILAAFKRGSRDALSPRVALLGRAARRTRGPRWCALPGPAPRMRA
jgi:hypothetical protein